MVDSHPLVELSSLSEPDKARHPLARAAIVRVTKELRKLLRSTAWPRPSQIAGAAYCALAKDRVLIADEQGVGKTPQSLLRILLGAHVPAVIVAPPSVLLNWKKEAGIWLPGIPIHRLDKEASFVPPRGWRGIVVTTWDLLRSHSSALANMRPRIVIADEVQYVLSDDTERAVHFDILIERVPYLHLLSGTPVKNRPRELWRLLHMLDPKAWPEHTLKAFKEMQKEDFDKGVQTRLSRRIKQYMLRRLKVDAVKDLTAKQYQRVRVEIPEHDLVEYRRVEKEFDDWIDEKVRREVDEAGLGLAGEELEDEIRKRSRAALSAPSLTRSVHLRKLVGVLKAPLAADWIAEAVRANESVVCFAHHQEVIAALAASLTRRKISFGILDGKTTKTRRFSLVNEFQDGKIRVLLASSAAKEGVTLTKARHVLFAERFWTSADEDQAADRLHRVGQKRAVIVWMLIALGTIDERMDEVVGKKRRMTVRTIDAPPGRVDARPSVR